MRQLKTYSTLKEMKLTIQKMFCFRVIFFVPNVYEDIPKKRLLVKEKLNCFAWRMVVMEYFPWVCFICLTNLMPLVSFCSSWKQKTRVFLMLSGGIERNQWHEMGKVLLIVSVPSRWYGYFSDFLPWVCKIYGVRV